MGPTVASRSMTAVALTDHGYMGGIPDFVAGCKKAGVKPIIGNETYLAFGNATEKSGTLIGERNLPSGHFLLLAKNQTGYRNLCKLTEFSYSQGFYVEPRIDFERLAQYSEGLICTSTCLSSHMASYYKAGMDISHARTWVDKILEIFTRDNFFFEVQVNNVDIQRKYNDDWVIPLSKEYNIPLVLTADAHHQNNKREEWELRGLVQCLSWGQVPHKTKYQIQDYNAWLYDEEFALNLCRSWNIPEEAVSNTGYVADLVESYNFYEASKANPMSMPGVVNPGKELMKRIIEGLIDLLGVDSYESIPDAYIKRAQEEFRIINDFGYSNYFLIVQDYINFAKSQNIPVGLGRGSSGGSLVAWSLGITGKLLDPIKHNLYFTRFLNPGRVHVDIDLKEDLSRFYKSVNP
jgi:DNA polymerase-3 subunit alpha